MAKRYDATTTAFNNLSFVAIVAPIDCSSIMLHNNSGFDVYRRKVQGDVNTQDTLYQGQAVTLTSPMDFSTPTQQAPRWKAGEAVQYIECTTANSGSIFAEFFL